MASRTWSWVGGALGRGGHRAGHLRSGAKTGRLREKITAAEPDLADETTVLEGVDFTQIEEPAPPNSISIWPSATARDTGWHGGWEFRSFASDFPSTTGWTGRV